MLCLVQVPVLATSASSFAATLEDFTIIACWQPNQYLAVLCLCVQRDFVPPMSCKLTIVYFYNDAALRLIMTSLAQG